MEMKNIKQSFNFCEDFINDMVVYLRCIDSYFDIEENKKEHKVLYNYYKQLMKNVYNVLKKNGFDME